MIVRKDDYLGQVIMVMTVLFILSWLVLEVLAFLFVFTRIHIHID
jgi:hypothetical protein